MVNMRRNNKILSLIITISVIVAGITISFYKIPNADAFGLGNNNTNSYAVDWSVEEGSLISFSEFASKGSSYEKTISFETPNLKEITFSLSWIDDKAPLLGRLGLDTLTLEITTPDGKKLIESAKSARKTKQGNIEIILPVNSIKPTALTLESEDILEAGKQLNENYFDYTWVDDEFTIKVSVQVGEIRPFKRLADNGNDFDLKIISSYYHASLTDDEQVADSETNSGDSFKETGYIPPSMCPRCKDYSSFRHRPSCPHYEDPFEDDPWDDDDDPWDDPDYQGYPLTEPWQAVFLFVFFLFSIFLQSMWIF